MKLAQPNSIFLNLHELHGVPEGLQADFAKSIPLLLAQKHDPVNFGMTEVQHAIYMVYEPKSEHVLGLYIQASMSFANDRGTSGIDFSFVIPEACFYSSRSFRKALLAMLWKLQGQIINHLADNLPEGIPNVEYEEVLSHREDEGINEDNPLFHVPGIVGNHAFNHSFSTLSYLSESVITTASVLLMENNIDTGLVMSSGIREHARLPTVHTESLKIDLAF